MKKLTLCLWIFLCYNIQFVKNQKLYGGRGGQRPNFNRLPKPGSGAQTVGGHPPPPGTDCSTCSTCNGCGPPPPLGGSSNRPPPPFPPPKGHFSYYSTKDYTELNKQIATGNQNDQCPCVKRPGTEMCITYDPRYQAATLTEAILNFPDLTNEFTPQEYDPSDPWRSVGHGRHGSLHCGRGDQRCKDCTAAMVIHLKHEGIIDSTTSQQVVNQLGVNYSPTNGIESLNCDRYYFTKKPRRPRPGGPKNTGNKIRPLPSYPDHIWLSRDDADDDSVEDDNDDDKRRKRQTSTGNRHIISCVNRGDSDDPDSDLVNLCTMCWVWRQLPDNYFPTYVNELICSETADSNCLSDMGACTQRSRNLNVLQNLGTETAPNWNPVTLSSGTSCECQVRKGTAMEAFVLGTASGKK